MENNEKIICKSKVGLMAANPLAIASFIVAFLAVVASFIVAASFTTSSYTPLEWIIRHFGLYVWFYFGAGIFVGIGIWLLFVLKPELTVTDTRVYGKIGSIKKIDLPINQISAIGTGIFSSVAIATSSGSIRFWGIINRDEITNAISQLLAANQKNTVSQTTIIESDSADELKKYKDLFDQGIISQEEFEAKKKQLLGL